MADGFGDGLRPEPHDAPVVAATAPPEAPLSSVRLRDLLRAQSAVAAESELPSVLRRVVHASRELVHARYAALGLTGDDGVFDEFVYAGVDPATVERIGHPPAGRGLLGLPITDAAPVRLEDLHAHPAFTAFPRDHPAMDHFLGVPIRIRGRVIGTLYLTDSANGRFSAEDEELVVHLAAAAAAAIDNARFRLRSARAERWANASAEVNRQLLAGRGDQQLDVVLRHARDAADADFATVALLVEPAQLEVRAAVGPMAEQLVGTVVDTRDSLAGQVVRTRTSVLAAGPTDCAANVLPVRTGTVIIVPLTAGGAVKGTLNIGRIVGAPAFADADTEHLAGFAAQAGIAMELDDTRAELSDQLSLDVDRVGADLNEHVIKELFAVALRLQGLVSVTPMPEHRTRLSGCIDRLDAAIKRIRATVFNVTIADHRRDDLHRRLLTLLDAHTPGLGHPVRIRFTRLTDRLLPSVLIDDVLSVVRDTMSDLARHTATSHVELRVDITADLVLVEIISDGHTVESSTRTDMLTAFRHSARTYAGTMRYFTPSTGGSHLIWTAHTSNGAGMASR